MFVPSYLIPILPPEGPGPQVKCLPLSLLSSTHLFAQTQSREFFSGKKFKVELEGAFEVARDGEAERFAPFQKLPHHRLLFHGSRMANFIGMSSDLVQSCLPVRRLLTNL